MPLLSSLLALFPSFVAGNRLIDGGDLSALANQVFSTATAITARAGGGQANATVLTNALNQIGTVASGSDSVMLPQAIPGMAVYINNAGASTLQVFGVVSNPVTGVGDRIVPNNSSTPQATATGVAQSANVDAEYKCYTAGIWKQNLSA